jgi:hypothetical protein
VRCFILVHNDSKSLSDSRTREGRRGGSARICELDAANVRPRLPKPWPAAQRPRPCMVAVIEVECFGHTCCLCNASTRAPLAGVIIGIMALLIVGCLGAARRGAAVTTIAAN